MTISTFYDRAQLVDRAVGTVTKALLEAAVLVVILLLLFLGNLRAAIVVALILPLSVLATFVLMRQFGLSANLMSLGGLAIAIGLLVDAAVVVVENVVAHLAHDPEGTSETPLQRVSVGDAGSRQPGDLGHRHHRHRVPAAADAAGPGGQAVHAGCADHRVRPGGLPAAVAHRDPGAGLVSVEAGRAHAIRGWCARRKASTRRCSIARWRSRRSSTPPPAC